MGPTEFCEMPRNRNKDHNVLAETWKELAKTCLVIGEGATKQIWVPQNKQRMRDRIQYSDGACVEGSKDVKDPAEEDKQELKDFTKRNAADFSDSFYKDAPGTLADLDTRRPAALANASDDQPDTVKGKKRKRRDLHLEQTVVHAKLEKLVAAAVTKMKDSRTSLSTTVQGAQKYNVVEGEPRLVALFLGAAKRMCLMNAISATSAKHVEEIHSEFTRSVRQDYQVQIQSPINVEEKAVEASGASKAPAPVTRAPTSKAKTVDEEAMSDYGGVSSVAQTDS